MKITIDIKTDNAAFQDNSDELKDILDKVVYEITEIESKGGNLRDSNGNTVGKFKVTGK